MKFSRMDGRTAKHNVPSGISVAVSPVRPGIGVIGQGSDSDQVLLLYLLTIL